MIAMMLEYRDYLVSVVIKANLEIIIAKNTHSHHILGHTYSTYKRHTRYLCRIYIAQHKWNEQIIFSCLPITFLEIYSLIHLYPKKNRNFEGVKWSLTSFLISLIHYIVYFSKQFISMIKRIHLQNMKAHVAIFMFKVQKVTIQSNTEAIFT